MGDYQVSQERVCPTELCVLVTIHLHLQRILEMRGVLFTRPPHVACIGRYLRPGAATQRSHAERLRFQAAATTSVHGVSS